MGISRDDGYGESKDLGMEYLIFFACVAVFFLFMVIQGIVQDKKKSREFERTLRENYGLLREREYSPERFQRMDRYFRKHPEEDQLDDITWNDLGMDEIFKSMNHTYSSVGEEYLYHTLRSVGRSEEELAHLEELINYFAENEDKRVSLQLCMAKLGYMGKYSLYDYLDNLDYLGERSNRKHYFSDTLFFAFLALMPFQLPIAVCGLLAVLVFNILGYTREKSEIEPYVVSFVYIMRLMRICGQLEQLSIKEGDIPPAQEIQRMSQGRRRLHAMERGSSLVYGGNTTGGNPLEILMDYMKMALHVDLIQFNRMLKILRENVSAVDEMAESAGKLETAVAIGAWRHGLAQGNGYCVPELFEMSRGEKEDTAGTLETRTDMEFRTGATQSGENRNSGTDQKVKYECINEYHPLLTNPVKNTIRTERGVLLTGSNASGKSTFLKTCMVNAILAQTVHTCTAESYRAPVFRIYSSMALRDDLAGGDSYYIVEIKSLKRILTAAAEGARPILCAVDEVLRGTNTVERIAASTQILKSLHREGVLCFAATHDIELTDLLAEDYDNYHFEEEIADGDIHFPYRLLNGKATTRNAIKLLELIGYDREIIERAESLAGRFLSEGAWT